MQFCTNLIKQFTINTDNQIVRSDPPLSELVNNTLKSLLCQSNNIHRQDLESEFPAQSIRLVVLFVRISMFYQHTLTYSIRLLR